MLSSATLVAGSLAGCGSSGPSSDPDRSQTTTTAISPSTLPQVTKSVGQSISVGGVTTTVEQVVKHFGSDRPTFQPEDKTLAWLGVRVRTCVSPHGKTSGPFGWYLFDAIDSSDGWYPALTWKSAYPLPSSEWPLPQYPPFSKLWPGQCAAGWVLIPVPRAARISKVTYAYAGVTRAAWQVP